MGDFEEVNKVEHRVEDQWHYKVLMDHGFEAVTKIGIGFVRSYEYKHPDGLTVTCNTGVNADYWSSSTGEHGYWAGLAIYLDGVQ